MKNVLITMLAYQAYLKISTRNEIVSLPISSETIINVLYQTLNSIVSKNYTGVGRHRINVDGEIDILFKIDIVDGVFSVNTLRCGYVYNLPILSSLVTPSILSNIERVKIDREIDEYFDSKIINIPTKTIIRNKRL